MNNNPLLSKAARLVNAAAVTVSKLDDPARISLISRMVDIIADLSDLQKVILRDNPELGYHFDSSLEKTPFMQEVADLMAAAETEAVAGNPMAAVAILSDVLILEPPTLAYETVEKRIVELMQVVQKQCP